MSAATLPARGHILLDEISWETYERLLREVGERRIRLTYDNGDLEIMTLSFGHENVGELISRLINILTQELDIALRSGGSTTLKRKLKRKGLEPDKCFWIKNEKSMRTKKRWNARTDPPPDLAVEVDISRSSMNRMGIYAALRIPEVWRYRAKALRIYSLQHNGRYSEIGQSLAFPLLDLAKVNEFLQTAREGDETSVMRSFAHWVRSEVLPLLQAAKGEGSARTNGKKPAK